MKKAHLVIIILAVIFAATAAMAQEQPSPAQNPATPGMKTQATHGRSPADIHAKTGPSFDVPERATPKELVTFITKLISGTPPRDIQTVRKLRKASLQAANQILAQHPTDDEREFAVQVKMNMLEKPAQLADFAKELKKNGHEKLSHQVRSFMMLVELRKQLMGEGADMQAPVEEALKFLEENPPQPTDMNLAYTIGMLTEMSGDVKLADQTYQRLAKLFAASKEPRLVEFSKILEGVVRRLNLVGQEMKLEGKLLDGSKLDWSKYAGKVVLVSFWSTEYPACLLELPNLKACYDAYHKKGFDIIAVGLDRNPANVADCVKARKIEWANLVGDGKPNPAMTYYGVTNLPTTMLLGKDGKVLATNVRGDALKNTLEKLLGPVEQEKQPAGQPTTTPEAKASK